VTAWVSKRLSEVTSKIGSGATPLGGEVAYKQHGIALIRSLNVHDGEFRLKDLAFLDQVQASRLDNVIVESGDILLNITGASVARCCLVPEEVLPARVNQHVAIVRPLQNLLLPKFLQYMLVSRDCKDRLLHTGESAGSTRQALTKAQLQDFDVRFPESINEQRRIVTLLDEALADIATAKANAEKNLQNARNLFSSHLQSIFTTRGEDWVEKPLGDIGKVSMCKRIFKEQTTPTGDIPFYKIGTFGKQADAFIHAEIYRQFRQKYSFPNKGDVLVSAAGTVGRRVVYDGEDAYFQDSNIVWIANDQTKLLNHFLYHFYGSCDWNSTQGATIARLYNDNLRQIVIAFPQSLDEQKRIATQLDVLTDETNRLTDIYRQKLTAFDDLKKSLLHQAFSGQL